MDTHSLRPTTIITKVNDIGRTSTKLAQKLLTAAALHIIYGLGVSTSACVGTLFQKNFYEQNSQSTSGWTSYSGSDQPTKMY